MFSMKANLGAILHQGDEIFLFELSELRSVFHPKGRFHA
jgi:hypothetical protein